MTVELRAAAGDVSSLLDDERLDYAAMDCVETNVAAQLRLAGILDVHLVLGSQWYFSFEEGRGAAGLRLDPLSLLEQLRLVGGVRAWEVQLDGDPLARLAELVESHGPVLVYGDAHALPWLPLHRRQHLEHTFLAIGIDPAGESVAVADTYTNRTPYGDCRPVAVDAPAGVVAEAIVALDTDRSRQAVVLDGKSGRPTLPPRVTIEANAAALLPELRERDAIRRFASCFEQARDPGSFEDFALACWLIARKRALHHHWLLESRARQEGLLPEGFPDSFAARVVHGWAQAAEFAYVAARRARAGRARPGTAYDLVRDLQGVELELVEELASAGGAR